MLTLINDTLPQRLNAIASPPKQLYVEGSGLTDILQRPAIAVVGSRKLTPYGRGVTERIVGELAGQGIAIISGLAFGTDILAHRTTLAAGGIAIAVLPTPLDRIYPAAHRQVATGIITNGGALVSEYASGSTVYKGNFVARNRIIAGLADAVLIPEAALKSGSLHTARFALDAGRDVLAIPGNITSPTSEGTNNLIKAGAHPVTTSDDVLHVLGIHGASATAIRGANSAENAILHALGQGETDGDVLQATSGLGIEEFSQTLTMLEITGKVRSVGANQWSL